MSADLVPAEEARLAELEAIVIGGLDTFVTVGRALAEISTNRLYRATHGTFVSYAQDRFGIGKSHAYRMISAAKVAEAVSPIGDITTESQARELVGLDDEEARGVLAIAQAGAKIQGREQPTAEDIRQSRRAWERSDASTDEMTPEQARDLTEFINITASFDGEPIDAEIVENDPWPHTVNTLDLDDDGRPVGDLGGADPIGAKIAAELAAADSRYAEQAAPTRVLGTDGKSYPAQPSPAVTAWLDSSQEVQNSGYLREFFKTFARADDFLQFTAERLGPLIDQAEFESLEMYAVSVSRFVDTVRRSRTGLRVINGGN